MKGSDQLFQTLIDSNKFVTYIYNARKVDIGEKDADYFYYQCQHLYDTPEEEAEKRKRPDYVEDDYDCFDNVSFTDIHVMVGQR